MTAFQRWKGTRFKRALPPLGECILFLPAGKRGSKLEEKYIDGIFLGIVERSSEIDVGTAAGVVRGRSLRRRPPSERQQGVAVGGARSSLVSGAGQPGHGRGAGGRGRGAGGCGRRSSSWTWVVSSWKRSLHGEVMVSVRTIALRIKLARWGRTPEPQPFLSSRRRRQRRSDFGPGRLTLEQDASTAGSQRNVLT